jgi:hypothetical protein
LSWWPSSLEGDPVGAKARGMTVIAQPDTARSRRHHSHRVTDAGDRLQASAASGAGRAASPDREEAAARPAKEHLRMRFGGVSWQPAASLCSAGALLVGAVSFAACGESAQDKAKAEVCSARSTIAKEVQKLQGLTVSSSAVDEAKSSVESISNQLKKITDAQPKLAEPRKEQVEAATSKFGEDLKAVTAEVAASLITGTSEAALAAAKPKLKASAEKLAADYKQALGPISC